MNCTRILFNMARYALKYNQVIPQFSVLYFELGTTNN